MKLLKKAAILSLCVLALSGCTKSSISTDAPVAAGEQTDPDKEITDKDSFDRAPLIEEDLEEEPMFDWEQVDEETQDLFGDVEFYPQTVKMTYEGDEEAKSVKLMWVLKDGTTEEEGMEYASEMVQKFNDILAVQTTAYEHSSVESFGGIWEDFALTVQVSTEDGTVLIDESYDAGEEIDLELPEYSGDGPHMVTVEEEGPKKPGDEKK